MIKSAVNTSRKDVSKLLLNTIWGTIGGTPGNPALTYEVVVKNADLPKFEFNGWSGQWFTGMYYIMLLRIRIPSISPFLLAGGMISAPGSLPFTMRMQVWCILPGL